MCHALFYFKIASQNNSYSLPSPNVEGVEGEEPEL